MQKFVVILTAVLSFNNPVAQTAPSQSQIEAVFKAAEAVFSEEKLVGLQAAIYANGEIADRLNLGFADLEHRVPVADATRFEVASINKTFTGLAVLMLEDAGQMDLDLPIQTYVPQFPVKPEGPITARQLAGGLGGIRHYEDTERTPGYYATHYDDLLRAVEYFQDDPLVAEPGTTEIYSSYGYVLLAAAIEQAVNRRYQEHITQSLLIPLDLLSTGFVDVRYPMQHRSRHYTFIDPYSREITNRLQVLPTMDHSLINGAGNMYSTASDLATFGGQFTSPGFLTEALLNDIYEPHYTTNGVATQFSDGWVLIGNDLVPRFLFFGGSYPGATAFLAVFPDSDTALAIVTNTWGRNGSNWTLPMLTTVSGILAGQ